MPWRRGQGAGSTRSRCHFVIPDCRKGGKSGIHIPRALGLWIPGSSLCSALECKDLLLEAIDKPAQQPHPDFVLAHGIFDAVFETGIVVDFHNDNAVGSLFEIDAIETVANRPRGAHRDV